MTKTRNLQKLLKQRDEELLALYRQINDPQRPPEPFDRVLRLFGRTDFGEPS